MTDSEVLDETLLRLHRTGPEFDGRLSNHAPMVVEAMVRRGHADNAERWVDWYASRLEEVPRPTLRIQRDDWRDALGDPSRLGDWLLFFSGELEEQSWQDLLVSWWPRLLPGLAASATHSVIRIGHAVQVLRDGSESAQRIEEVGQCLAYWAARWLAISGARVPDGQLDPVAAIEALPASGNHDAAFPDLLTSLESDPRWPGASSLLCATEDPHVARQQLVDLVTAATLHYRTHGHGNAIMLVHAATAPNAVLRVLPSLPTPLWPMSARAAWTASAAITTIYNPTTAVPNRDTPNPSHPAFAPAEVFARAVEHRDEHVIKLTDTALDVLEWTKDARATDAVEVAMELIDRE